MGRGEPIDPHRRRVLQGLALTVAGAGTACGRSPDDAPTVEDVARIDRTTVARIVRPRDPAHVAHLLADSRGAVSIGGARFSMGGQIAAPGSLHLDMRSMNRLVRLDTTHRTVRVQAGMRWRELQDHLDPHGLAIKVMQSYGNFSVGGSVSVNCHGRYVGRGALVHTIRSLQVTASDGALLETNRTLRPDLFAAVVGGYGGVGVVTEVELDLDTNTRIERRAAQLDLADYPAFFAEHVRADPTAVLHNADLTPPDFDRPLAISWHRTQAPPSDPLRLTPTGLDYDRDQNLIWAASELPGRDALRERFLTRRVLEERPVVWRNREASLDASSLEPRTRAMSTYLLQEYFVPVAAFVPFAREIAAHPQDQRHRRAERVHPPCSGGRDLASFMGPGGGVFLRALSQAAAVRRFRRARDGLDPPAHRRSPGPWRHVLPALPPARVVGAVPACLSRARTRSHRSSTPSIREAGSATDSGTVTCHADAYSLSSVMRTPDTVFWVMASSKLALAWCFFTSTSSPSSISTL